MKTLTWFPGESIEVFQDGHWRRTRIVATVSQDIAHAEWPKGDMQILHACEEGDTWRKVKKSFRAVLVPGNATRSQGVLIAEDMPTLIAFLQANPEITPWTRIVFF